VTLEAHRGRRVLIALLRNAQCAVCNLWVHTTAKRAPAWREAGLDVIAIFESSASRLREQFDARRPPFAVLADPDGAVHEAYGSRSDAARVQRIVSEGSAHEVLTRAAEAGFPTIAEEGSNFFRLPAEVLVDRDGTVALAHVAEDVANHLPEDVITRFSRLPASGHVFG
jgi:peroxiredoxin